MKLASLLKRWYYSFPEAVTNHWHNTTLSVEGCDVSHASALANTSGGLACHIMTGTLEKRNI